MMMMMMFIFDARNFQLRCVWYEKPVPKTGTRKWSRFMAPFSGVCVMGLRFHNFSFLRVYQNLIIIINNNNNNNNNINNKTDIYILPLAGKLEQERSTN